jgi:hypothetical protein
MPRKMLISVATTIRTGVQNSLQIRKAMVLRMILPNVFRRMSAHLPGQLGFLEQHRSI